MPIYKRDKNIKRFQYTSVTLSSSCPNVAFIEQQSMIMQKDINKSYRVRINSQVSDIVNCTQ